MDFHILMKQERKRRGLTQKKVAEQLCVETNTYSQYENGKRKIDVETFFKIANVLSIDISMRPKELDSETHPFLKECIKYPTLAPKKEAALVKLMRTGDKDARLIFIRSYLRLVWEIGQEFVEGYIDFSRFANEGSMGLAEAADSFKMDANISFVEFATPIIRRHIAEGLQYEDDLRREYMRKIVAMYPHGLRNPT